MAKDLIIRSSTEEFITFKLQEKEKGIQVRYENELDKDSTIEENSIVQKEGNRQVKRNVKFYKLKKQIIQNNKLQLV